jgi:hypothetical protein
MAQQHPLETRSSRRAQGTTMGIRRLVILYLEMMSGGNGLNAVQKAC